MPTAREAILAFVQEAQDHPDKAVDRERLEALRQAALDDAAGMTGALIAPNAPQSWENRLAIMLGSLAGESDRMVFPFPQGMDVMGFHPVLNDLGVVAPSFIPGNILPSLRDIDVKIDVNQENTITSLEGQATSVATNRGGTFISLESIDIILPRLMMLRLDAPRPEIGMTFRWKRGGGIFRDTMVSVTMFPRRQKSGPSANVASSVRGL